MAGTGSKLVSGLKKVTTAGTAVQLEGLTEGAALNVTLYALGTNEGEVVVGGSGVVAAAGSHATPTRKGVALVAKGYYSIDISDPADIWIDATVSKDGVAYTVLVA